MIAGTLLIKTKDGRRRVQLSAYLDPVAEERAHDAAYHWIKQLRRIGVAGTTFRERFTIRGDSLWWFSEIYLHKQRAVLDLHRAIAAVRMLIEREHPLEIRVVKAPVLVRYVLSEIAAQHKLPAAGARVARPEWILRLGKIDWRARVLTWSAHVSRLGRGFREARSRHESGEAGSVKIAAFIHRAFWRSGGDDGSAESYIGPVLKALEDRVGRSAVAYVGVGPERNFRARSLWDTVTSGEATPSVLPIERYAPFASLAASRRIWEKRRAHSALLLASVEMRGAAVIDGVDCWPVIREELAGIAWLQWPWSARAMDEAASALDTLKPAAVVTYAEAGGWGRALMLEARRRGIPSAGLQHGFIYRHWLNYRHEPDEMDPVNRRDRGYPAPTVTLLFDGYAERHLRSSGSFPPERLRVTGSPRLDAVMAQLAALTPEQIAAAKRETGAKADDVVVLVAAKEREARGALPAFLAAARDTQGVAVVIKAHPAETPQSYAAAVEGIPNAHVVGADVPLAPLLAASAVVVTVNSTVALDAAVAGIPALVIGLPNNLSPLVEAGVLAGADHEQVGSMLQRILYDEGFRQQLSDARRAFLREHSIESAGTAAVRAADAIIELMHYRPDTPGQGD